MVIPLLAALDPRKTVSGTPFENVAEEVLNGLFCHYEPPVSKHSQHKAAKEAKENPKKYTFSEVKKEEATQRTNRLHRRRQAYAADELSDPGTPAATPKKGVTWRDEKQTALKGLEGRVELCAVNHCDFFGFTRDGTGGGGDLAENLSPSAAQVHEPKIANETQKPPPIIKQTPTLREPLKDGSSKKTLYDDEGNPIGNVDVNPPANVPPAPSGLSQLRQMAEALDEEPQSRGRGSSATIKKQPSQSPVMSANPNHYDTPEQFEESDPSSSRVSDRPATAYRGCAMDLSSYQSGENSIIDEANNSYPVSPSKRSEVFSDLTMDPAIKNDRKFRTSSPALTSQGIEMDAVPEVKPQTTVQTTSTDQRTKLLSEVRGRTSTVVYDEKGNIVERRASLDTKEVVKAKASAGAIPGLTASKTEETKGSRKKSGSTSRRLSSSKDKHDPVQKLQDISANTTLETNYSSDELKQTSSGNRDPSPRMSMEPLPSELEEQMSTDKGPLPPTPRRKSVTQYSLTNSRSDREERKREEEIRARLSEAYMKESNKSIKSNCYSWKTGSKSDGSCTSDDEIRAEVSTVEDTGDDEPIQTKEIENRDDEEALVPTNQRTVSGSTLTSIDELAPVVPTTSFPKESFSKEIVPTSNKRSSVGGSRRSEKSRSPRAGSRKSDSRNRETVQSSTDGSSSRSGKFWKGWKKTIGQVKKLVHDIDEQRLPPSTVPKRSRR